MTSNAETLKNTTAAVVKATGDDTPAGLRAFNIVFKTVQGTVTVTFDRFGQNSEQFDTGLNQMVSNAIAAVLDTGNKIMDYTIWMVR